MANDFDLPSLLRNLNLDQLAQQLGNIAQAINNGVLNAAEKAPVNAEYIVGALDATLTAERVATDTTSITWDFATSGQAKAKRAALTGDVTASADFNATTIAANAVTNAKLRQSAALSVVGNSTNATANVADIAAGTDGNILRRSGTGIGFGTVAANAGSGLGSAALKDTGTSGNTIPLLDGANTWSALNTFGAGAAIANPATVASATATPAGGSTSARLLFGTTSGFGIYYGSGSPTVAAAKGSLYLRSDGSGTSDRAYINTDASTTWTALTTAA